MKRVSIWKISVRTSPEAEDAVSTAMAECFSTTASSFTDVEHGGTTVQIFLEKLPRRFAKLRHELAARLDALRECGLLVGTRRISVRRLAAQDWAESWKRHFKPLAVGGKLLVKPSWSKRPARRGEAIVVLDPGLSFGTGQHPTTKFCLEQLVAYRRASEEQSLLDVGTGSGILAISAAKLGYGPIEAVDFDPDSVRVARENAKVNGVAKKIHVTQSDVRKMRLWSREKFSIVCANLLADLLLAERERLVARLDKKGVLVVAGILKKEFAAVRCAYEKAGLELVATRVEKEWQSGSFAMAR